MNLEQLQALCMSFPGATEDIKWENHLCFCVKEKMFLITSLDQHPTSASFKVTEEDFDEFGARDGIGQAAYFAKRQWLRTDDLANISGPEWERLARQSYELVKAKLTKKAQRELDELENA